jgi:hypothetical protein
MAALQRASELLDGLPALNRRRLLASYFPAQKSYFWLNAGA